MVQEKAVSDDATHAPVRDEGVARLDFATNWRRLAGEWGERDPRTGRGQAPLLLPSRSRSLGRRGTQRGRGNEACAVTQVWKFPPTGSTQGVQPVAGAQATSARNLQLHQEFR